jgi:Ca2+-binding RTX toxin-like protein
MTVRRPRPAAPGRTVSISTPASNGSERDRITDFNAAEGDLIELDSVANGRTAANGWWPIGGASLIFRGAMDPANFVSGAVAAGQRYRHRFVQLWTVQSGGNTYLVGDSDGDLVLDDTDLVVRFDGIVTLTTASFANTFVALAGHHRRDTLTGTAGADQLYALAGNDTLNGLARRRRAVCRQTATTTSTPAQTTTRSGRAPAPTMSLGGTGNDMLAGEAGRRHACRARPATTPSMAARAQTRSTAATTADTLRGEDGNDSSPAGFGNDGLTGGPRQRCAARRWRRRRPQRGLVRRRRRRQPALSATTATTR